MKAFLATVLLMAAPAAFAQTFQAAPPVAQVRADVFDWREVPQGQTIPITRAVFDSSGYLLYDENGQMISVPFAGNLYALQFGKTGGGMYFVNDGNSVPTLYVPDNGFLENAVVSGARWYPFPQRYFYTRPVYLGPAPSWDAYYDMRWYPGMTVYGGFWGFSPWRAGIIYSPMSCLTISVGTRICRDWDDFCLFGRGFTGVRPIIIRDTRPIFIDQRDRWDRDRSRGNNDRNWDRPVFRESSRPGFDAPARHSEERAQGRGQNGSDRFNFGTPPSTPGGVTGSVPGRFDGSSREREYRPIVSNNPAAPSRPTAPGVGNNGGFIPPSASREREYGRISTPPVPNMTPVRPSGGFTPPSSAPSFPNGGSREREYGRNAPSGGQERGGYAVPNMTPARPGGNAPSFPSGSSREREFGRGSDLGRGSEPARTRTFEPSRESRSAPSPSRESQPSRARETRK